MPPRQPIAIVRSLLLIACVLSARLSSAQDAYEIQVYPSETMEAGVTMFEFHTNVTPRGSTSSVTGHIQPNDRAWHETLEITRGFTRWFEVGVYQFTSYHAGDGWQWVGSHVRPRVAVPASWHWPVGLSVSQEIGYQRSHFSANTWTWEIRPIVDQQLGKLYWSANLAFERALAGPDAGHGFDVSPAIKVSYQATPKVATGIEYYADVGSTPRFEPRRLQGHQLFPAIDLTLSPDWEFNLGVGAGLTPASDRFVIKMIIGRRVRI